MTSPRAGAQGTKRGTSLPIGLMPGAVVPAMSVRLALRGLIPNRHDDARISTITSFLGYVGNHGICLYDHSRVDAVEPRVNLRFDGARASVHEDFYFHWLWHPTAFRWLMTDDRFARDLPLYLAYLKSALR